MVDCNAADTDTGVVSDDDDEPLNVAADERVEFNVVLFISISFGVVACSITSETVVVGLLCDVVVVVNFLDVAAVIVPVGKTVVTEALLKEKALLLTSVEEDGIFSALDV